MFHEFTPWRDCDHGYDCPPARPRMFLRQAQDRLPLRRTVQVRLGPIPRYRGTVARHATRGTSFSTVSRLQFMKHPG